ncbi:hypothetical protein CXB51_025604 [Gossypium anomalum]|uniref:Uncharacterized protein n=1 Tax=Gossypium anomalum TaxID=47600 RepID=A0A8J5Y201_9ROSI|nr:hypothetical protein CXB51_025604 [Gossypium anomalum]
MRLSEYGLRQRSKRKILVDKAYSKAANVPTFLKKLMNITGISEQWVAAKSSKKEIIIERLLKTGEERFIGCAQLLLAWLHSHFWKVEKVSYRIFSENYSPLKVIVATPRRDDITEEK